MARRVESILRVAADHRTGVPVELLADLLPEGAPASAADLTRWITDRPDLGTVVGATAFRDAVPGHPADTAERRRRGEAYWNHAVRLSETTFSGLLPLLCTLAVTGSTAYGEPETGDDLDFLAVARADTLWVFLAGTYLRLRMERSNRPDDELPHPCFNYVLDQAAADREFIEPRGLLFAREALTARPVMGESYYRGLLRSAGWMRWELPRLYLRWSSDHGPESARPAATPLALRGLNLALFPIVATYLQFQGLIRNWRLRRSSQSARSFRTVTAYRRLMFATDRFEKLRLTHEQGAITWGDPE